MINIIKSDLFRLFKGKGIYIIITLIIGFSIINAYSISPIHIGLNMTENKFSYGLDEEWSEKLYDSRSLAETREILLNHGDFKANIVSLAQNNVIYYFMIAIVVIILSTDFSCNTIKNSISTNISRKKYYFSKLLLSLGIGTILLFSYSYISYFMYLLIDGDKVVTSFLNITLLVARQLPLLYGIISLLVTISLLTRKTAVFNTITIPLLMIMQVIFIGCINLFDLPTKLFDFEFEAALGKLCINYSNTYMLQLTVIWTCIMAISCLIGYKFFEKKDI